MADPVVTLPATPVTASASDNTPLTSQSSPDKSRLAGALDLMMRQNNLNMQCKLPAIVVEFDREKNIATVQPLIYEVDVSNGLRPRSELVNINVLSLGGGGFHISFPLSKGDLGWIEASDRDISQFKESLVIARPNTGRNHSFEDGLFVPDVYRQYVINEDDAGAMVMQSTSGATRISIRGDNVVVTAPTIVTVDCPETVFTGNVTIQKNLTVDVNATVMGDAEVQQTLTAVVDAVVAGISVKGHGHISSVPGQRTSGVMIA